jgi:hypothetical protein
MLDPYNFDFSTKSSSKGANMSSDHYSRSNTSSGVLISDEHYMKSNNNTDDSYSNAFKTYKYSDGDDKYATISTKYGTDPRFASISSQPIEKINVEDVNPQNKGILDYIGNVYNTTKDIASTLKDRATEYELGTKIQETGSKTFEVLKSTGTFVYEKSSDIVVI